MYDKMLIHVDRQRTFEAYMPFLESVLRRKIANEAVLSTAVKPCEPTVFGHILDPDEIAATDARNLAAAWQFVDGIAQRFAGEGITLQTRVLVGDPNEVFRTYAARARFDLVVIAPSGRRYLLTGKPKAFRRALRRLAKPVMILQAAPSQAQAA